jgi:hypothetical protein
MILCPYCGEYVELEKTKCPECGEYVRLKGNNRVELDEWDEEKEDED